MSVLSKIGVVFARKWIGGITVHDALMASEELNHNKEKVTINYLGEDIKSTAKVNDCVDTYFSLLDGMHKNKTRGGIAIKPTQLGFNIHYSQFLSNYEKIVGHAEKLGIFVWLDMEDYYTVDGTIKAYMNALKKHDRIGVCLQAKLKRTKDDVRKVVKSEGVVRLVKGAYPLRSGITYSKKQDVDDNYIECMEYLFREADNFMIATHDERMINKAVALEIQHKKRVMFGMLKGIRPKLASKLADGHEDLYIYVPFGSDWLKYSMRRMDEMEHAMLFVRSIVGN